MYKKRKLVKIFLIRTVAKSEFCGNLFPPKVRYAVDVREIIPSIMSEIRHYFSQKNYTMVGA